MWAAGERVRGGIRQGFNHARQVLMLDFKPKGPISWNFYMCKDADCREGGGRSGSRYDVDRTRVRALSLSIGSIGKCKCTCQTIFNPLIGCDSFDVRLLGTRVLLVRTKFTLNIV